MSIKVRMLWVPNTTKSNKPILYTENAKVLPPGRALLRTKLLIDSTDNRLLINGSKSS